MGHILGVDIETASGVDIKVGPQAYSQHESTIVYCVVFGYARGKGDYTYLTWRPGDELTPKAVEIIKRTPLLAHNASFEQSIWENILAPQFGFPEIDYTRWHDTMSSAGAVNLPQGLEGLSKQLSCATVKDVEGAKLMKRMARAKLKDGEWTYPLDTPENRERLEQYCRDDVGATLDCWYRLPALSPFEEKLRRVDQKINARGMYIDPHFVAKCSRLAAQRAEQLKVEINLASNLALTSATQVDRLKKWLVKKGLPIKKVWKVRKKTGERYQSLELNAAEVEKFLADPELDPAVRAVLVNRQEMGKTTSLAKLRSVVDHVGRNGRVCYELRFHGTHTGRWSSKGVQMHNLPRNKMGKTQAKIVKRMIDDECIEGIAFIAGNSLRAMSQSLRAMVVAPPGYDIIAADYSAIEARVVAWLAGQEDVLNIFRSGRDIYVEDAAKVGSDNRDYGKVQRLSLGFGMGTLNFHKVANDPPYNLSLSLKESRRVLMGWRKANPKIVAFWRNLENAARDAIKHPGVSFAAGRIKARATKSCLRLYLPSGRALHYWHPRVVRTTKTIETVNAEGKIKKSQMTTDEIRFMQPAGVVMKPQSTYSGKLVENVTQAVARELLGYGLVQLDEHGGYPVVIHVHDSAGAQVPTGTGDVEEFAEILARTPAWAEGLPVAAEGYRSNYFRG